MDLDLKQLVINEAKDLQETWNKHDAKQIPSFFTDDAVFTGAFGHVCHGKSEIEAGFNQLFKEMPGATLKVDIKDASVRMISSDIVIFESKLEYLLAGATPPIQGYVVSISKKVDDDWKIIHLNAKVFPPQK